MKENGKTERFKTERFFRSLKKLIKDKKGFKPRRRNDINSDVYKNDSGFLDALFIQYCIRR